MRIAPLVVAVVMAAAGGAASAQDAPGNAPRREAFRVCQDPNNLPFSNTNGEGIENRIAELFAKDLGLPVAYVSGYLRTVPPPGKKRLQGADATHAWVSVWTGAHGGWFGFDPTNAMQAGIDHIQLAVGRDFSDVSPVYGVFVGSGENKLKVEVDVVPVNGVKAG